MVKRARNIEEEKSQNIYIYRRERERERVGEKDEIANI